MVKTHTRGQSCTLAKSHDSHNGCIIHFLRQKLPDNLAPSLNLLGFNVIETSACIITMPPKVWLHSCISWQDTGSGQRLKWRINKSESEIAPE